MGVTAGERREESLHPLELEPSLLRGHWAGFQSPKPRAEIQALPTPDELGRTLMAV